MRPSPPIVRPTSVPGASEMDAPGRAPRPRIWLTVQHHQGALVDLSLENLTLISEALFKACGYEVEPVVEAGRGDS